MRGNQYKLALLLSMMLLMPAPAQAFTLADCTRYFASLGRHADPTKPRIPFAKLVKALVGSRGDMTDFIARMHSEAGVTFRTRHPLNFREFVFTSDPKVVKEVLNDTDRNVESAFSKEPMLLKALTKFSGKDTLFASNGAEWRAQRKQLSPAFSPRATSTPDYIQKMDDAVTEHITKLAAHPPKELDFRQYLTETALDVLLKMLFNHELDQKTLAKVAENGSKSFHARTIAESINPLQTRVHDLPNVTKIQRTIKELHQLNERIAEDIVQEFEKDPSKAAPFMQMLETMGTPLKGGITRDQVKKQIMLMIIAGHETTAHTLTWAFRDILDNPAVKDKLVRLVRGGDPKAAEAYIDQIWDESLRLHPAVTFLPRRAVKDTVVGGVNVAKDSTVMLDLAQVQRREDLFGVTKTGFPAKEFHPERFSPEQIEKMGLTPADLETFTFGSGPRVCIGARMARAEARNVFLKFFREFDIAATGTEGKLSLGTTNQGLIEPVTATLKRAR